MKSTVGAALSGHRPRRRPLVTTLALGFAAVLTLSGCAAGQISQTADQVAAIDGANATVGDIGIRDALFQTPTGAKHPAGSDVRLLFWLTNDGLAPDTLAQVSTPGAASVEISGTATVEGQSRKQFGPDSEVTITAKGLTADLTYGQSLPVTFVFAKAGAVTVNVTVQVPADRTGERETIHILPTEPGTVWGDEGEAHGAAEGTVAESSAAPTTG